MSFWHSASSPSSPDARAAGNGALKTRTFQACWECWHLSPTRAARREYSTCWNSCWRSASGDAGRRKNYREIADHAADIPQPLLKKLGAEWNWFRLRYKHHAPCA